MNVLMNVLSLFDGMSCGRIALDRAGIEINDYFASEIDKYASKVSYHNYPDIVHMGDVCSLSAANLPKIDLLIGGSPCQSFSLSGKGEGFDGKSKLFWEYARLLKEVKPKYFLLENVKMKKEWEDVITKELGVDPIEINSSLVSAQNRRRLYWTNIPNVTQPDDKGILLENILDNKNFTRAPYIEKFKSSRPIHYKTPKHGTLRANAGSQSRGVGICDDTGMWRKLTVNECEELQTVPKDYTSVVSDSQRYKMLGNGWTVDVIAHIFKGLK